MTTPRSAIPRIVRLHPEDAILIAIDALPAGFTADGVAAAQQIPRGHKMALRPISAGEPIRKFGQPIGIAAKPIAAGEWVHDHNCIFEHQELEAQVGTAAVSAGAGANARPLGSNAPTMFQGYRRGNGSAGTRNYVGVLTSVNCSATVARYIAEEAHRSGLVDKFPGVDGIVPIMHSTGCGMAGSGGGYDILDRCLWGYAANPNMGGVLMVGLGCEVLQIERFKKERGLGDSQTFRSFTIQGEGGTKKAVDTGLAALEAMLPLVAAAKREPIPASELTVGLQCGGSDGYSGITANPALGAAVDLLVQQGGTAILSETPEIYGAEHLLIRRMQDPAVAGDLLDVIRWWESYVGQHGGSMNNNPSPGNKAGGISTILEKSLGAAMKGGTTGVTAVYRYAQQVKRKGLVFMDTPGFDPVSATGQVAGGANLICFTTGRGSAYGCKPTPSLKLSTTTDLYRRMEDDMDINCGDILDGISIADKGKEIFESMLRTASGERTKSEKLGYGDAEFVPWQIGAVM
ncbi:UxaA family hydrolase [Ferrovibrio sp.]|uniref:UxaA family hydrolase n=1 Tax=Ferrovibrio sp. TaxID=1917215 RepID=UPI0035B39A85